MILPVCVGKKGGRYQIQSFKKMGQKNRLLYIASYGLYERKIQKLPHTFYDYISVRMEK
jgi:hypothetical protein